MDRTELIGLIVTLVGVSCFSVIFTVLYLSYTKGEIRDIQSGNSDIEIIDQAIYNNLPSVKVRKKIIKAIKSFVFYGLMVFIIPFFIFSIVNKIQGNIIILGDKGLLVVASGSMSTKHPENTYLVSNNLDNQFDKFDLIVIEKVSENDLKLYDVISYMNDKGTTIIHRIVDINTNEDGKKVFTTRGDSNGEDAVDSFKSTIDDIQGRYINKKIPMVGMFVMFLQSPIGMASIVAMLYCLFMVDRLNAKVIYEHELRLDKLSKVLDYKQELSTENIKVNYIETIYYKGYEYTFDRSGFVDKKEIEDKDYLEKSNNSIIRVSEDKESNLKTEKEYVVDNLASSELTNEKDINSHE